MVLLTEEQKKLVSDNSLLAVFLARKRWEMAPQALDLEELISLANQGLVSAAQRWRSYCQEKGYPEEDIAAGKGFSIFSRKRIIGAILDWQKKDADYVSRYYRTDYKALQRAGYPDTQKDIEALSLTTGLPVERIKSVLLAIELKPVSLQEMTARETDLSELQGPAAADDVESDVFVSMILRDVFDTIVAMPLLYQVVLSMRYFARVELQGIAEELDMPFSTVREIHSSALLEVHSAMVSSASH